jgi:hypothetical protein
VDSRISERSRWPYDGGSNAPTAGDRSSWTRSNCSASPRDGHPLPLARNEDPIPLADPDHQTNDMIPWRAGCGRPGHCPRPVQRWRSEDEPVQVKRHVRERVRVDDAGRSMGEMEFQVAGSADYGTRHALGVPAEPAADRDPRGLIRRPRVLDRSAVARTEGLHPIQGHPGATSPQRVTPVQVHRSRPPLRGCYDLPCGSRPRTVESRSPTAAYSTSTTRWPTKNCSRGADLQEPFNCRNGGISNTRLLDTQ